jgi:hypothetical protein
MDLVEAAVLQMHQKLAKKDNWTQVTVVEILCNNSRVE